MYSIDLLTVCHALKVRERGVHVRVQVRRRARADTRARGRRAEVRGRSRLQSQPGEQHQVPEDNLFFQNCFQEINHSYIRQPYLHYLKTAVLHTISSYHNITEVCLYFQQVPRHPSAPARASQGQRDELRAGL